MFAENGNLFYIIFGSIALILSFLIYISKKKTTILVIKAAADAAEFFTFLMLGPVGYPGAIQNALCIIREGICFGREKNVKGFDNKLWFVFVLATYSLIPILTFETSGWLFLIPLAGSVISLCALYTKNVLLCKILTFPAQTLCLIYSAIAGNWFAVVGYALMLIGDAIGIVRELIKPKKKPEEENK